MTALTRLLVLLLALVLIPGSAAALDIRATTTPGATVPSLTNGEIAINRADKRLFFRNVDGTIGRGSLLDALPSGRKAVELGDAGDLVTAPTGRITRGLADRLADLPLTPADRGADRTGVTAADAALAQIMALPGDITIPPGAYRLSQSATWPKGRVYRFAPGARLLPDSGVAITILGRVEAGSYQIFGGAGSVVGIGDVQVAWWGAFGDGDLATGWHADDVAIQAAFDSVAASYNSDGERQRITLKGTHALTQGVTLRPSTYFAPLVRGSGTAQGRGRLFLKNVMPDGTTPITASRTALTIQMDASTFGRFGQFDLSDLSIVQDGRTGGNRGLYVVSTVTSNPVTRSTITNVKIDGFSVNRHLRNVRKIQTDSFEGQVYNTGDIDWSFEAGPAEFTGDFIIRGESVAVNGKGMHFSYYAYSGGGIAGIDYPTYTTYYGDLSTKGLAVGTGPYVTGGSGPSSIQDIFHGHYRADGFGNRWTEWEAKDGANIDNIIYSSNLYVRGVYGQAFKAFASGTGGQLADIHFAPGGRIANTGAANSGLPVIEFQYVTAPSVAGLKFYDVSGSTVIRILHCPGPRIIHNEIRKKQVSNDVSSATNFVVLEGAGGSTNRYYVDGNFSADTAYSSLTGAAVVNNAAGATGGYIGTNF